MNAIKNTAWSPQTYLVVVDDYLIAEDLAESIAFYDAKALVVVRHLVDDAVSALKAVERLAVAFVAACPQQFAGSALAKMIHSLGGKVVLLGDAAEDLGKTPDWAVLHRPFSQGLVENLLTCDQPAASSALPGAEDAQIMP